MHWCGCTGTQQVLDGVQETLCSLGPKALLRPLLSLRIRPPCTGVKNPKMGKRGFRSQKTPISPHPRKGRLESKNPHFPCGALCRNGDFLTRDALFWGGGKWGFFDSETLFSPFSGFLTPVQGGRIRNPKHLLDFLCSTPLQGALVYNSLLRPLSRKLLWIFSSNLPGNFALKNGGDFGEFFLASVPTKRGMKTSQKNSGKIRGNIRDENSKNSGNFRSATSLT